MVNGVIAGSIKSKCERRYIWTTFQKEGIHCYPAALTDPNLKEVDFLGYPHRHIFHFKVSIEVEHNDRNIEFILFKRWLEILYKDNILQLDYKSCEMMGEELAAKIEDKYPDHDIMIDVSEDGESGAHVEVIYG